MSPMLDLVQDHPCSYLPDRTARMRYRMMPDCPPRTYEKLLERGWRRFGDAFFRPVCRTCVECRSLRIDVDAFEPNRSMRRTMRKNEDLTVILRPASMTREHLDLYERYHDDMHERRGWRERQVDSDEYWSTFVSGGESYAREMLYLDGERLLGVALVDVLPNALSAVYCYYDPDERQRGIGVLSVLAQVELARRREIPHLYLGYWIRGNQSMKYKARYRPHEILRGRPRLEEETDWRDGEEVRMALERGEEEDQPAETDDNALGRPGLEGTEIEGEQDAALRRNAVQGASAGG